MNSFRPRLFFGFALAICGACDCSSGDDTDLDMSADTSVEDGVFADVMMNDSGGDSGDDMSSPSDGGTDASDMAEECNPTHAPSLKDLPFEALPRCAAETRDEIDACEADEEATPEEIDMCVLTTLAADETPPVDLGELELNCLLCHEVQELYCAIQACPDEWDARTCCRQENDCDSEDCPACDALVGAFDACVAASDLSACYVEHVDVCFAPPEE